MEWSFYFLFIYFCFIYLFFCDSISPAVQKRCQLKCWNLPAPAAHYSEWPRQPTLSRSMHYPHKWISLNITNSFVIPLCNLRFCQMVSLLCVCVCVLQAVFSPILCWYVSFELMIWFIVICRLQTLVDITFNKHVKIVRVQLTKHTLFSAPFTPGRKCHPPSSHCIICPLSIKQVVREVGSNTLSRIEFTENLCAVVSV